MRWAIWYHLYNLKNVKSTHVGVLLLEACKFTNSSHPPWAFFMFFKLYKCYQIMQRIAYMTDDDKLYFWMCNWRQNKKVLFPGKRSGDIFSIFRFFRLWLGYTTYNNYLHYNSDIENISLYFSFFKTVFFRIVLMSLVFLLYISYEGGL